MSGRSTILAFHQVSDQRYPGINNIHPGDFCILLDLFREWGFVIQHDDLSVSQTTDRRNLVLTFDDGYYDQFAILHKLAADGYRPIVFIPTAFIAKTNTWEYSSRLFPARHLDSDQIKSLSNAGVVFGSHGVSHKSLTGLSEGLIKRELSDSKKVLEDITGRPVDYISFPFGRTNPTVNSISIECGYRNGFVLDESINNDNEFVLPRIPVYGNEDYYSLKGKLVNRNRLETLKSRIINGLAGGTIITSKKLK